MDTKVEISEGAYKGKSLDEVLTTAESHSRPAATGTPKTGGARVLAQVLGFKFSYYQVRITVPASYQATVQHSYYPLVHRCFGTNTS